MSLYLIGQTAVAVMPGHVTTMLHDGALVHAVPHDTDDYGATAKRLGYGEDRDRMNRDHELLHSLIAAMLGQPESPVMRAVAEDRGEHDADGLLGIEEDAVLAVQRLAMAWGVNLLDLARSVCR